jgi:hypothetical protein
MLAAGGYNGDVLASCELYDFDADKWFMSTPMSRERFMHCLVGCHSNINTS